MRLRLDRVKCPVSTLLIVSDEAGNLRALDYAAYEERMCRLLRLHYGDYELVKGKTPAAITDALERYFDGDVAALDDLPVATGGTPFQRSVWKALRSIPAGKTCTYGHIAAKVGKPTASRAVGAANGSNPIAIVVPCHRVIGAGGALTGYAGGIKNKQWLLDHERQHAPAEAAV